MATTIEFPSRDSSHNFNSDTIQPGKVKVPYRIELTAERYSNLAKTRASGGTQLAKIILPMPTEGFDNSISHTYGQQPAKEQSLVTKLVTGEAVSVFRDAFNFIGKQFQDAVTTISGIDYGRIPADMSESTYTGTEKRKWTLKWDLVALNAIDSDTIMKISNTLTSYSLPGARASSDRADAPPMWRIKVLSATGSAPGYNTRLFLGDPKVCVLNDVSISRDMSVLYSAGTPLSVGLSMSFQEIEPVYGQDGKIRSRAEVRTGGGLIDID